MSIPVLWLCGPSGAGKSAVVANMRTAGCGAVIVSGVTDPSARKPSSRTGRGVSFTYARLRASPEELSRRLVSRGEDPDFVAAALREAARRSGTHP